MSDRKISDYSFDDLGIEHAQYFQGFGVSHTPYEFCATGSGSNLREAIDDCLEMMAQDGFDTSWIESDLAADVCKAQGIDGADLDKLPDELGSVETYLMESDSADEWTDENGEFDGTDCELYYYVGIRWNETPNLDGMDATDLDAFAADTNKPDLLRQYADLKAQAMRLRLSGDIPNALHAEGVCERVYRQLPENLKW